jgi:exopolysaccharide biosynthesis polyprenyl glycosylphosphotransferase
MVDLVLVSASSMIALAARFGNTGQSIRGIPYVDLGFLLVPIWLCALAGARAYEIRVLGIGEDEYKRIIGASWWLMAVIAVVAYSFKLQFARGFVAIVLPVGTVMLLVGRYAQRKWLHHWRRRGRFQHRVLAVGGRQSIEQLAADLADEPYIGLRMVGACLADGDAHEIAGVPVLGSLTNVLAALAASQADTLAVAPGPGISPGVLRHLSWEVEGLDVDLVVAPALLDVAGPRIQSRPVTGLPFVHVEKPELSGPRQLMKASVEWTAAATAFLVLLPLLLAVALLIRLDSPGAPVFRQTRVGRRGREFTVYKLRTMYVDAESLLEHLRTRNEASDGPLFKIREDPRVTRVGKWLRRWSIDELPQLWNVVRGDMALVGPRPPLPSEVSRYDRKVSRRLLVRPGITGLWQVSGRSDLSWKQSVRLDLYYVENWSLALDAMIIWKTVFAVFRRSGAY